MHDVTTWDVMGIRETVECDCTDGHHHGINDDDDEVTQYYMGRS